MVFCPVRRELLLNILRLRYDHPLTVLTVGNISGSSKLETHGHILFAKRLVPKSISEEGFEGETGMSYTDNPIISYSPLDDNKFHNEFLSSIKLRHIKLLLDSSWSIARIFRVTIQQIGPATNAASAARPTSGYVPRYMAFDKMVFVLRRLQLQDALQINYKQRKDCEDLIFYIDRNTKLSSVDRQRLKKAGIHVKNYQFTLSNCRVPNKAIIITRSAFGVMSYLSKGVLIPDEDVKKSIVAMSYLPGGKIFDWQIVLDGIITIKNAQTKPKNAMVAVPFMNHWFYIDNSDTNSKQTIILLTSLISLITSSPPPSPVGITRNT